MASTMESSVDEATKVSKAEVLMSLNIAEVRPEQLFDSVHIESWSPQLAAYFPLGCLLATIRFAAWVAGEAVFGFIASNHSVQQLHYTEQGSPVRPVDGAAM